MKEKNRIRNFKLSAEGRTQLLLLGALLISCLFIFRSYLFGDEIMVFNDIGEDTWQLYTMHYVDLVNHLKEGTFSLWDFTNGFGINLFNLNLFDPSVMLLCLLGILKGTAHMLIYLAWIQVLKVLAAGWIFYRFLSKFTFSRHAKLLAAFAYGLNGYLMVWGQHYQFGIVTVYFPLMLLLCEKMLRREKGRGWFPVTVFLCGIYSVYFTYMSLIGVGFYLLLRVMMLEGLTVWERIRRFLGGCLQILLGLGMSLGVFLPMASVLLTVSSRVGSGSTGILDTLKQYLSLYPAKFYESVVMRLFSTNLQVVHSLADGHFETAWNYYEDPVFFCSTLSVFLNVQLLVVFWKSKVPKRTKAAVYAAAILMALTVILQIGGCIFNGFNMPTNRYTFVMIPFFLMGMAWMWDYLKNAGRISWIALFAVYLVMNKMYDLGYHQSVFAEYRANAALLAVTGEVMVLCLGGLMILKNVQIRKLLMGLLTVVLVVNVVSEGGIAYQDRIALRKQDTPVEEVAEQTEVYLKQKASKDSEEVARASLIIPQGYFRELYYSDIQDALTYLENTDKEFYRVEKDFISATTAMDSLGQGYRGISSYNSVMNKNIQEFVNLCYPELYYKDTNHYAFWNTSQNNGMAAFTGIRYLLSRDGSLDHTKYRLMKQFGGIYLYENVQEAQMAKFYTTAISEKSFEELCTAENREELLNGAIAVQGGAELQDLSDLKTLQKEGGEKNLSTVTLDAPARDSLVTGKLRAESDGYVLFMIPYEDGWELTIDGEQTELIRGDKGFLACSVKKGDHDLVLSFHAPLLKEGIILSVIFWLLFAGWQLLRRYRQKKQEKVTEAI